MQKSILATALSAAFLISTGTANAACEAGLEAQDGYIAAGDGTVVLTGSKGITRAGDWSKDKIFAVCEGAKDLDAEAAAKAAADAAAQAAADAAAAAAAAAKAAVPVVPVNKPIKLDARALFATNSAELSDSGMSAVSQLADGIAALTEVNRIVVVGHTDSNGSEAYNQGLSEERAESVRAALAAKLPDEDIAAIGRGETRPIASNDDALGRARNRRVEIVVIGLAAE